MSEQHTPGPWEAQDPLGNEAGASLWIVPANLPTYDWNALAVVCSDRIDEPGPRISTAERDANARLIAAAPELLEALEQIKHSIGQARVLGNDWKRELALIENTADAALLKARGQ